MHIFCLMKPSLISKKNFSLKMFFLYLLHIHIFTVFCKVPLRDHYYFLFFMVRPNSKRQKQIRSIIAPFSATLWHCGWHCGFLISRRFFWDTNEYDSSFSFHENCKKPGTQIYIVLLDKMSKFVENFVKHSFGVTIERNIFKKFLCRIIKFWLKSR